MTDHVEFLEKVITARKHRKEYVDKRTNIFFKGMGICLFGFLLSIQIPLLATFFLLLLLTFEIICLFKQSKAKETFKEEFKEEAFTLDEYDELTMDSTDNA